MITVKKIWSFLKNYWYIPLVMIVSSIGYLLTKGKKIPTDEILKASKKTHEVKNLKEESKKEIKEIVKKHYNDPERLSKDISDLFGIKYVPKDLNNSD